jgi:hypothetical protein
MGSKQMGPLLAQFMKDEYPLGKADLFAAFIERCVSFTRLGGAAAMITMQSWMFLSSFAKIRSALLTSQRFASMAHLGTRAFDSIGGEVVSSTAFVLVKPSASVSDIGAAKPGVFIRLVEGSSESEKIIALRAALDNRTKEAGYHLASGEDFAAIPGSPIVYWLSEKMRRSFRVGQPLGQVANLRQGLATADNSRFLRQWWEVSHRRIAFSCTSHEEAKSSGARWFPYNKGGEFRKWYGNQEYVVNWENDGEEIRIFGTENGGRPRSRPQNTRTYFSPSVSWSKISSGAPAFRAYPTGFIYDVAGTSIFSSSESERRELLAFLNSEVALQQLAAVAPTLNYEVGQVSGLPFAATTTRDNAIRSNEAVTGARTDWDSFETSWEFSANPIVTLSRHC